MFDDPEYWDSTYSGSLEPVEWFCEFKTLLPVLRPAIKPALTCALILGNGTSQFPDLLYDSGVKSILVLDDSQVAIDNLKEKHNKIRTGLTYLEGNLVHGLQSKVNSFDLIIDKGVLDCTLTGKNGLNNAFQLITEMYRVMKTPSVLVLVSHSPPSDRLHIFKTKKWKGIEVKVVKTTKFKDVSSMPAEEKLEDFIDDIGWSPNVGFVYIITK